MRVDACLSSQPFHSLGVDEICLPGREREKEKKYPVDCFLLGYLLFSPLSLLFTVSDRSSKREDRSGGVFFLILWLAPLPLSHCGRSDMQ